MPTCGYVRLHLRSGFVLMTIKGLAVQDTASPFSLLLNEIGTYIHVDCADSDGHEGTIRDTMTMREIADVAGVHPRELRNILQPKL